MILSQSYPLPYTIRQIENSPDAPSSLWRVPQPPPVLYVQGSELALPLLSFLPQRGLAVVGTRTPHARSLSHLHHWMRDLRGSNLIIISGLARGIDAAAHKAAIDAGLPTIAILGCGLDLNYPQENFRLRNEILEAGGLIISEFPPRTPARAHHFLQRNRLIAGWSQGTWIVEAGCPSGALNTAKWARELDRLCFAVPGYPGDPHLTGNQLLLDRDHALPFWGTHSLGAAWIQLIQSPSFKPAKKTHDPSGEYSQAKFPDDNSALQNQVKNLTHLQGGAQIDELLNWAVTQGWTPQRFFLALQSAIQQGFLNDQNGTLVGA